MIFFVCPLSENYQRISKNCTNGIQVSCDWRRLVVRHQFCINVAAATLVKPSQTLKLKGKCFSRVSFCNPVTYVVGRSYDSIATENKTKSCDYRTTVLQYLSVLRQKECRGDVLNMFKIKKLSHDLFIKECMVTSSYDCPMTCVRLS